MDTSVTPITFFHQMGMQLDWRQDFVDQLGAVVLDEQRMIFPQDIAQGYTYFMEVLPGLMVLLVDCVFRKPITFTKLPGNEDYCVAYYDLSDEISLHRVNNSKHTVGYHAQLGMGIVDGTLESTYTPPVGQRMYSFRLLISKRLLKHYLEGALSTNKAKKAFDSKKNTIFFYSHMDSRTKIALLNLRERNHTEASFELQIKGTALQAFSYLIEKMSEREPEMAKLSATEIEQVMQTQRFLMDQLLEPFPGIELLAQMAGMSTSKYKKLFKKLFKSSPNSFFMYEKFLLAKELLQSGNYNTVNEITYELGYTKAGHFAATYKKFFRNLPGQDFVKQT